MHTTTRLAMLAAISCLPVLGHAQQCATGYTAATVTGRVSTINISTTKQVGQICVTLTTADGRELLDDCGALVGKIDSTDTTTGTSILNHTAVFDILQSFQTKQDVAQITGVLETDSDGSPCAMSVVERMTKLKWGTGIFFGATMDVTANGSISFCPGKNLNTFQLTGSACVRKR